MRRKSALLGNVHQSAFGVAEFPAAFHLNTADTGEMELNLEVAQADLVCLVANEREDRQVGRHSVHARGR